MRAEADELTMLLVAEGERLAPALHERLVKHGLNVHACSRASVADTAFVVAPDLVVLAGAAAEDGGLDVLVSLAARPATAGLPVVVIGDPGRFGDRASTFRHGVVAVIERSASADELARRIAEVAEGLPERTGESSGAVDEGGVRELVELLAESLRTGILSVTGPDGTSARVVLRADRPVSEVISQIVERLRPLTDAPDGVRYEFHESPTGKFGALETPTGKLGALDLGGDDDSAALSELSRCRLLLIEQNPARADLLAQGLRAHGARVAVADGLGRGLELARDLAPDVIIVDGAAVDDWALEALRQIRRDRSLRWASLLLADASQLWRDERRPDIAMLAASIGSLMRSDRELARRLLTDAAVGTRLEVLGPVRTLRMLAETKLGLRMHVQHPRIVVDVDLSDGIVVGASARLPNASGTAADGPAALATLLGLASGRVQIERAEAPRTTNIMSPVDDAIAVAAREDPVVALSQPPPSLSPAEPTLPPQSRLPREAGDVARLVSHLEQLLGELREHAEPVVREPLPYGAPAVVPQPAPVIATGAVTTTAREKIALPPAEETTSTVGLGEIARLRRQMRDSSQRLLAVVVPPPAALPAPPQRSRRPTLVGVAVDVVLPPATPAVATPQTGTLPGINLPPAEPSGPQRPSPGRYTSKPSALGPPPVKLPPPKLANPAPRAKMADGPPPAVAPPERAKPPAPFAVVPVPVVVPEPAHAQPPLTASRQPNAQPDPEPERRDREAAAADSGLLDVSDLDSVELISNRPPPAPTPSFFSLLGAPPSAGPSPAPEAMPPPLAEPPAPPPFHPPDDATSPERVAPRPWPSDDTSRSVRLPAAGLRPSDDTPLPEKVAWPKQPRSKLPLVLFASAVSLVLLGGLGFFVYSRVMKQAHPVTPIVVGAPLPTPLPVAPPVVPPVAPPVAPLVVPPVVPLAVQPVAVGADIAPPPPPSGAAVGPGPDDPVEGVDADFDLGRLRIVPVAPPTSRRVRSGLFARLLRQANQTRRQHRLDEAEQVYRHVLAMDAENGRASAGLSLIYLEREQAAEAIFWAQRLVRLQSIYASNWVLLGDALRLGNNVDGARRAYVRAIVEQASNATAHERLQELTGAGSEPP